MNKEEILSNMDNEGYLWPPDASIFYDILMKYPEKGSLLEIGTGRGDSASFWARVKPEWIIYTIDSFRCASDYIFGYGIEHLETMVKVWRTNGLTNILPITANSKTIPWETKIDVLYIDGDHSYEMVKNDFERFTPFLKEGGVVFMDDYYIEQSDVCIKKYLNDEVIPTGKWRVEPLERMCVVWPTK